MDETTARTLCAMTTRLYAHEANSFSETRQRPWAGWEAVLAAAGLQRAGAPQRLRVLDVACGNMRFARFLSEALPETRLDMHALDNCPELVACADTLPATCAVTFQRIDIIEALLAGDGMLQACVSHAAAVQPEQAAPDGGSPNSGVRFDLVVCFGFMHHVPGAALRTRLLAELAALLAPGGHLAVALWQFGDDARLARRAADLTAEACAAHPELALEHGDYLLGWKDAQGLRRYCHCFDDDECERLARELDGTARLAADFTDDGSGQRDASRKAHNRYLVWRAA